MKSSVVLLTLLAGICALEQRDVQTVTTNHVQDTSKVISIGKYRQTVCVVYGENVTASNPDLGNDQPSLKLISPTVITGEMRVRHISENGPLLILYLKTRETVYWGSSDGKTLTIMPMVSHPSTKRASVPTETNIADSPVMVTLRSNKHYLGAGFPICKNDDVEHTRSRRTLQYLKDPSPLVGHVLHVLINKPGVLDMIPASIFREMAAQPKVMAALLTEDSDSLEPIDPNQSLETGQYGDDSSANKYDAPNVVFSRGSRSIAGKYNEIKDGQSLFVKNAFRRKLGALANFNRVGGFKSEKRHRRSVYAQASASSKKQETPFEPELPSFQVVGNTTQVGGDQQVATTPKTPKLVYFVKVVKPRPVIVDGQQVIKQEPIFVYAPTLESIDDIKNKVSLVFMEN